MAGATDSRKSEPFPNLEDGYAVSSMLSAPARPAGKPPEPRAIRWADQHLRSARPQTAARGPLEYPLGFARIRFTIDDDTGTVDRRVCLAQGRNHPIAAP